MVVKMAVMREGEAATDNFLLILDGQRRPERRGRHFRICIFRREKEGPNLGSSGRYKKKGGKMCGLIPREKLRP